MFKGSLYQKRLGQGIEEMIQGGVCTSSAEIENPSIKGGLGINAEKRRQDHLKL